MGLPTGRLKPKTGELVQRYVVVYDHQGTVLDGETTIIFMMAWQLPPDAILAGERFNTVKAVAYWTPAYARFIKEQRGEAANTA